MPKIVQNKRSFPPKKIVNPKVSDKKMNEISSRHSFSGMDMSRGFLVLLMLFVAVSGYAIGSFSSSNNDYLNKFYSSVLGADDESVSSSGEVSKEDAKKQIFKDVPVNHKNAAAIESLYNFGILTGYSDGNFKPDNTINRAEFLVILSNAVDADFAGKKLENCFSDVKTEWFAAFVCYAKEAGWVNGYADGTFKPGQSVAKAEAVKIIFAATNYPLCADIKVDPYIDVPADSWMAPYACAAKEGNIVSGKTLYTPFYSVTRGDSAQLIYNTMAQLKLLD
ncbi:MAG: S-layer homology domain-containing protein [Candidatus Peregrinibacteria bacterium]|nr:S-layer homology domain-containing protein [Candidatus Peregrinibacteria bacterium]